ncbi:MAG TPA: hypothetical protein DCQ98_13295 [Planctomycetaceae bacterium]|nr:hypothetical protein [Planctomycetaceae bacterium]
MSAGIIVLADAVTVELNTAAFTRPLAAVRLYEPIFELAAMATLHVSVVPRALTAKVLDRGRHAFDYEIDVAIQQKVEPTLAHLDELMALVEEVGDHLRTRPLTVLPDARCIEIANAPIWAGEHLQELRQFTSVLTLTYRRHR